ncbi:MAG: DNA adenine methylase [Bacteroidia bacterium]
MRTPITYYGGKQRLVKELLQLIPNHGLYCEPFMGGGALFFAKEPSKAEIINDLNGNVTNFYSVAQSQFTELKKLVNGTLHSREIHTKAREIYNKPAQYDTITRAWAFWVLTNQGFAGKIGSWALSRDGKTGKTLANKREGFTIQYAERLKRTQIENKDALEIIKQYDSSETFFYLDPPYQNSDCGHYKGYTETDYKNLLDSLISIKGKFLLSSYPSGILNEYIKQYRWQYKEIQQKISVTRLTKKQKTEALVWNYNSDNSQRMHFSNEKCKRVGAEYLPVKVKNSGATPMPVPKVVPNFDDNKKVSLERCRKILEQSGKTYTDEEIIKIRKLLYKLGNLEYKLFTESKTKLHDKLNSLRKGINGRTSRKRHKYSLSERTPGTVLHSDRV